MPQEEGTGRRPRRERRNGRDFRPRAPFARCWLSEGGRQAGRGGSGAARGGSQSPTPGRAVRPANKTTSDCGAGKVRQGLWGGRPRACSARAGALLRSLPHRAGDATDAALSATRPWQNHVWETLPGARSARPAETRAYERSVRTSQRLLPPSQ